MLWISGLLILALAFILFSPTGAHGGDQFAWFASALLVFLVLSERLRGQNGTVHDHEDTQAVEASETADLIAEALTAELTAEKERLSQRVRQLEAENADLRRFAAEQPLPAETAAITDTAIEAELEKLRRERDALRTNNNDLQSILARERSRAEEALQLGNAAQEEAERRAAQLEKLEKEFSTLQDANKAMREEGNTEHRTPNTEEENTEYGIQNTEEEKEAEPESESSDALRAPHSAILEENTEHRTPNTEEENTEYGIQNTEEEKEAEAESESSDALRTPHSAIPEENTEHRTPNTEEENTEYGIQNTEEEKEVEAESDSSDAIRAPHSAPPSLRDAAWSKIIADLEKGLKRRMPKKCRAALDKLADHPAAAECKEELDSMERIVKRCEFAEGNEIVDKLR